MNSVCVEGSLNMSGLFVVIGCSWQIQSCQGRPLRIRDNPSFKYEVSQKKGIFIDGKEKLINAFSLLR